MAIPIVTVRCSNPVYTPAMQIYTVDVEFKCDTPSQQLYGMNVRFFFDKSLMSFKSFSGYATGYGTYNSLPKLYTYDGVQFGFTGQATYVNGILVLKSQSTAPLLPTDGWLKLFQLNFIMPVHYPCPSIIWDRIINTQNSFTGANAGICITLQGKSYWETIVTQELAEQFNWVNNSQAKPYGYPIKSNCI